MGAAAVKGGCFFIVGKWIVLRWWRAACEIWVLLFFVGNSRLFQIK